MRTIKDAKSRRREILASAAHLFAHQGVARTTVSEIAADVPVAKGLVYYYFASKDEIVSAVIDALAARLEQALLRVVSRDDLSVPDKLRRILKLFFRGIERHAALLDMEKDRPDMFARVRDRLCATAFDQVRSVLKAASDRGLVQVAYPDYMLTILIRGRADLYLTGVHDLAVHAVLVEQVLGLDGGSLGGASRLGRSRKQTGRIEPCS